MPVTLLIKQTVISLLLDPINTKPHVNDAERILLMVNPQLNVYWTQPSCLGILAFAAFIPDLTSVPLAYRRPWN